jgi:hypothetical protein
MPPFVLAWAITVAVESPIVAAFYPRRRVAMAATCAIVTSVTNLAMNVILPRWLGTGAAWLLAGEIGALLIEAAAYAIVAKPRDVGRALAASAVANGASYGVGLLLPALI